MISKAPLPNTDAYTDLASLQSLKAKSHKDDPAALEVAVKQFESMFVSMMLKSMRDANQVLAEGNFMNSNETRFYQDMFDSQLSVSLASDRGIGLKEVLMRQLGGKVGKQSAADPASAEAVVTQTLEGYDRDLRSPAIMKQAKDSLHQVDELIEKLQFSEKLLKPQTQPVSGTQATDEHALSVRPLDPIQFESPEAFVTHLFPIAREVGAEMGVDPKVLLAQAALETGWGRHVMPKGAGSSFNLFGIKADSRWKGEVTQVSTLEYRGGVALREKADFRSYDSYEQSFRDYLKFLHNNPRYQEALQKSADSEAFVAELQQAGYATDPRYSEKITRIMQGDRLQSALEKTGG